MAVLLGCGHAANAIDGDGKPSCAICAGIDQRARMAVEAPDLTGRVARCSSIAKIPGSGHGEKPSSTDLAFFEFRGEGSRAATESCGNCGYALFAHGPDASVWKNGQTGVQNAGCPGFEPHGPWECDIYYCGCRGWD